MDGTMEIELIISSVDSKNNNNLNRLSFADTDITIGPLLLDTVKLESHQLQGRRATLIQSRDNDSGDLQLVLSTSTHSRPIEVDGTEVHVGENRIISESSKILMGDYRIRARLHSTVAEKTLEQNKEQALELETFSPDELALNIPAHSILHEKASNAQAARDQINPITDELTQYQENELEDTYLETESAVKPKVFDVFNTENISDEDEQEHELCTDALEAKAQRLESLIEGAEKHMPSVTEVTSMITEEISSNEKVLTQNIYTDIPKVTPTPTISETPQTESPTQLLFNDIIGVDNILNLDFHAVKILDINGRITHRNKPLANITIDAGSLGEAYTDSEGKFLIPNIPEGTKYELEARLNGYKLTSLKQMSGIVENTTYIELNAVKLSRVSGKIKHQGKPLQGVILDAGPYGTCTTDENGLYTFHDIPEDYKLQIKAHHPGFSFTDKPNSIVTLTKPDLKLNSFHSAANSEVDAQSSDELEDSLKALMSR